MSKLKKVLKRMIAELSKAEAYENDWYGYATNQLSHFAIGVATAALLSQLYFAVFGEFVEKGALWFVVAFGYMIFEITRQGWNGRDTLEDWIFFAVYGAGLPIFLFHEVEPGSPVLMINSQLIVPLFAVVFAHLFGGIVSRMMHR